LAEKNIFEFVVTRYCRQIDTEFISRK